MLSTLEFQQVHWIWDGGCKCIYMVLFDVIRYKISLEVKYYVYVRYMSPPNEDNGNNMTLYLNGDKI